MNHSYLEQTIFTKALPTRFVSGYEQLTSNVDVNQSNKDEGIFYMRISWNIERLSLPKLAGYNQTENEKLFEKGV
ncbi:hypothetical protein [Bacillus solitudinis]|uniref:hypothetical protein n=1 Tax=Bacillus solitudinis TaxID=2014074 RepID=UPI000C24BD77|nr:hypothetical protein [Bacillus solitudinis]